MKFIFNIIEPFLSIFLYIIFFILVLLMATLANTIHFVWHLKTIPYSRTSVFNWTSVSDYFEELFFTSMCINLFRD